jgi:hypothetical protein
LRKRSFPIGVVAVALLLAGERVVAQRPTVRDSVGISIVTNQAPAATVPTITTRPTRVNIGAQPGDSTLALYRVSNARLLSDGRVIAVNGLDLLWFSADGRLTARNGGLGDGPTEFRAIAGVAVLAGDTIVVVSQVPRSLKLFAPNGRLVRTSPIASRVPPSVTRLSTGEWIGRQFGGEQMPAQPALFREHWYVARYTAQMSELGPVAQLLGKALFGDRAGAVYQHATPDAHIGAAGGRIAAGSSDRYEVSVFDSTGRLRHVIRNTMPNPPVPPPPATPTTTRSSEIRSSARTLVAPLPATAPAYSGLAVAHDGSVWVRRPGANGPTQDWHIYDRDGALVAVAKLPARFRPTEITRTQVLGIQMDDLDVETIRLLTLIR